MTLLRPRSALFTALALASPSLPLAAQEAAPTPASPEACALVDTDAARLACYDKLFGHTRGVTIAADAAAVAAQQARREERLAARSAEADAPATQRARQRLGELFKSDGHEDALANAGKGSLLD